MIIKEIKELIKMLDGTDINELTFESEGDRIVIKKGVNSISHINSQLNQVLPLGMANIPPAISNLAPQTAAPASGAENISEGLGPNQMLIVAPMVGTLYRSPSPDADPYVQIGQIVEPGQVVCIIEAMKLMNEIESEYHGKIVEVLVENAHPVEYGQPLFVLEKV